MSEQSIRVELAQVFRKKWASDFSEDYEDFELADAILASPVIRRIQAETLRYWADEMDNTDDPDAVYVHNGDIELWMHAVADRIEKGE